MKIVVTGSLGHIGRPLTKELLAAGHKVTVISSNPERKSEIEGLGATAAIGSIADKYFLTRTFTGADVVYTMLPPGNYRDQQLDLTAQVEQFMRNYSQAIAASDIKRVIHLSSIGAHLSRGNGLLQIHYIAENILKAMPETVHVSFMRPTGFYYNLFAYIGMIKSQGIMGANFGGDDVSILVAPEDIASAIAETIKNPPAASRSVRYIASEETTCQKIAGTLGREIGKPDLQWRLLPGEQVLQGAISMGMNPKIAAGLVEMYEGIHSGLIYQDYFQNRPVLGKIKVKDFAKEFAAVYQK